MTQEFTIDHFAFKAWGLPFASVGIIGSTRRGVQWANTKYPQATFFLAAHRAFIIANNFFRIAGLIGLRFETVSFATFLGAAVPFCLAHQAFFAAAILERAAALIVRGPRRFAGAAWRTLAGRPLRADFDPSPTRAAIARSIRPASCLSCATKS